MVGSGTSINLTNETGQILNALKTKRRLPSLEATVQWLFASLDAESKKEINSITDFLALPPPLVNVEEVMKHHSFSRVDLQNAIDVVFQKVLAERLNPNDPGHTIGKGEIDQVIDNLVKEKKEHGLAHAVFRLCRIDIIEDVYSKLKKSPSSGFNRVIHDKPGIEHGENSKSKATHVNPGEGQAP